MACSFLYLNKLYCQHRLAHKPGLYCLLLPKQIKFMTQKNFKGELNAAAICSIKPSTNYGITYAKPCYQQINLPDVAWCYTANL